ncbi:uncharacterized protein LY89DRAFT_782322 [Mollisia scopiformis]|uniref:Uncharacterized protein n=1 Tax=Mollisia scopiformis TaxID=149040 RepID=A0A194XAF7_MOLSC|nr:uncharacterized protein LY89DRAFT_782322 [Mollisia scopiformis]KUJ17124.1 hypothetical protein LY89DRAFT_782322 [Mollisia scopiformis]
MRDLGVWCLIYNSQDVGGFLVLFCSLHYLVLAWRSYSQNPEIYYRYRYRYHFLKYLIDASLFAMSHICIEKAQASAAVRRVALLASRTPLSLAGKPRKGGNNDGGDDDGDDAGMGL